MKNQFEGMQMAKMMDDIQSGKVDAVIVKNKNRFSDSPAEVKSIVNEIEQAGVEIIERDYFNAEVLLSIHSKENPVIIKEGQETDLLIKQVGEINLPTGKIIISDPGTFKLGDYISNRLPLATEVNPGKYPVSIYSIEAYMENLVCFAEIKFLDSEPVEFRPAEKSDGTFSFGADSAKGSFMDEAACAEIQNQFNNGNDEILMDLYSELNEKLEEENVAFANWNIEDTDLNIVAFDSGEGDGVYPAFWGYDKNSDICCLIIDFMMYD